MTSVICLGDKNVNLLSNTSNEAKLLRQVLKISIAFQLVNEPTRVTENSASLIYHIITIVRSVKVERIGIIDAPSIIDDIDVKLTDHKLVFGIFEFSKHKQESKLVNYRNDARFNIETAIKDMSNINLDEAIELGQLMPWENFRRLPTLSKCLINMPL